MMAASFWFVKPDGPPRQSDCWLRSVWPLKLPGLSLTPVMFTAIANRSAINNPLVSICTPGNSYIQFFLDLCIDGTVCLFGPTAEAEPCTGIFLWQLCLCQDHRVAFLAVAVAPAIFRNYQHLSGTLTCFCLNIFVVKTMIFSIFIKQS